MTDRIYLGTVLGDDNKYYKAVVKEDLFAVEKSTITTSSDSVRAMAIGLDGSIFVGEGQKIRKYNPYTLERLAESPDYGSVISCLAVGIDGIYAGGVSGGNIKRYDPVTLNYINQSSSYGGYIRALAIGSDGSIYAGGTSTNTVRKYNPTTLDLSGESGNYGSTINALAFGLDGSLYVGGETTTRKIWKVNPTTLSLDAESVTLGRINSIVIGLDGSVYIGGGVNGKFNPITLEEISRGTSALSLTSLARDSKGNIIATASGKQRIYKFNKDDFVLEGESNDTGAEVNAVSVGKDDGIYVHNITQTRIDKMQLLYRILGYRRSQ